MRTKLVSRLFALASALIFLGIALMIQPFGFELYTWGFPVLLAGIAGFLVLDHLPDRRPPEDDI